MAEWTGLQIAQEFCKRKSLPVPQTLTGATDDTTNQIWGLLNEGMQDMAQRYDLQALQKNLIFTHAGGITGYPWMAYAVGHDGSVGSGGCGQFEGLASADDDARSSFPLSIHLLQSAVPNLPGA